MIKVGEIKTKDEFIVILKQVLKDIDVLSTLIDGIGEKMKEPKIMLNLMLQSPDYNIEAHSTVQNSFNEFNKLKKILAKIKKQKDDYNNKFTLKVFKSFGVDTHEFSVKVIDLNAKLEKCKKLLDEQIIRCIEYFNDREVEITL